MWRRQHHRRLLTGPQSAQVRAFLNSKVTRPHSDGQPRTKPPTAQAQKTTMILHARSCTARDDDSCDFRRLTVVSTCSLLCRGGMKPVTLSRPCRQDAEELQLHSRSPQKPAARKRRRPHSDGDDSDAGAGGLSDSSRRFWVGSDCVQRVSLSLSACMLVPTFHYWQSNKAHLRWLLPHLHQSLSA